MKKWLCLAAALAAIGVLSRLPHPARDISKLIPVQAVYLYYDQGELHIETDTGDHGSGPDLAAAAEDLKARASGELFLDTAEFLLLASDVPITEEFYTLLRPSCRVCYTEARPDMSAAAKYLSIHKPELTLAKVRADARQAAVGWLPDILKKGACI